MLTKEYRCNHTLPLFRSEATATLERLKFYLETLEAFIDSELEKEMSNLKRQAEHIPDEDKGEFWAWHYPVHWEHIFASQLRASFVVTLMSLAESHLGMVAKQVSEIASTSVKSADLRGSLFERHLKFGSTSSRTSPIGGTHYFYQKAFPRDWIKGK